MSTNLENRRSFFKNALKKSLPILGIGILSQLPLLAQATNLSDCQACKTGCYGSCQGSCDSSCKGSCSGNCYGGCSDACGTWWFSI